MIQLLSYGTRIARSQEYLFKREDSLFRPGFFHIYKQHGYFLVSTPYYCTNVCSIQTVISRTATSKICAVLVPFFPNLLFNWQIRNRNLHFLTVSFTFCIVLSIYFKNIISESILFLKINGQRTLYYYLQSSNINWENGEFSFKASFLYFIVLSHLSTFLIQMEFITNIALLAIRL